MGDRFLVTPARGTAGKGKVFWLAPREGGGGGLLSKFYTGRFRPRVRPRVRPLTLLYTIFDREGTSFVHLLLTNGTLFTHLV